MTQFLIAYNPRKEKEGFSGEWKLVDALDKYDAIQKVLDIPVPGHPRGYVLENSPFMYLIEIRPEHKVDLK